MQLQQLQPKTPSFQNNINFIEPISICRLIEKPRQLIDKLTINKIYPEEWENYNSKLSSSIIGNQGEYHVHGSKKIQVDLSRTEMNVRSLDMIGSSNKKNKNCKYSKNRISINLKQGEQLGIFGQLLYDRAKGRNNWIWPLNHSKFNNHINNPKSTKINSNQLQFNSQFQSGNLLRVYNSNTNPNLYTLLTHNDTNTFGYNQWFYFKVRSNNKIFQPIRFQIINMRKRYSCFNKGMKIAIFNQGKLKQSKIGWERGGQNIQYLTNQIKINENSDFNDELYTLGWDYRFQMKNQWVYFAYSYPYTYTDLRLAIQKTKKYKGDFNWIKLCSTALKNQLFMLKIDNTANPNKQKPQNESQQLFKQSSQKKIENIQQKSIIKLNRSKNKKRQYSLNFKKEQNKISTLFQTKFYSKEIFKNNGKNQVKNQSIYTKQTKMTKIIDQGNDIGKQYKDILIIMGRAHPGQTPSSFMMEGVINSILKQTNNQTKYLKQNLNIYIIPMLNPDGVIHGNTRTSITGNDLNRRWTHPNSKLHPQILKIKQYFKKLTQDGRKIFAMVDLHAHTKKQGSFLYGCCDRKNYINHGEVRLLNTIIGKIDSNFNSLYSSHYVSQSKKSTARVNFYRQFKCFSYTFQLSFLGANQSNFHFSTFDYYNLGENLLKSLAYFHAVTKAKRKSIGFYSNSQTILTNSIVKKAIKQHFDQWKNSKSQQYYKQEHSQGSSSAPSQCNYSQQYLLNNMINKKQSKNLSQSKQKSRYLTKSLNKVNRRSISFSTQQKQKIKPQKQTIIQKQNKPIVKNRRIQIINRLPNINVPYKIQQKVQDDHMVEFHTFNFKSKKSIWRNNKKIIKNQQQFLLKSTIG